MKQPTKHNMSGQGPLSNLRVVEFAALGPVPLAGQLLADMGARVTVVDRASAPQDTTDVNRRGKRSIALNLKSHKGVALAHELIAGADVLIEGHRPGVMERLGLGPEVCPQEIIYGRMTGWGQTGPLSATAGHDINYLGLTGALHAMGPSDRPPPPPLNLVADYGGGAMFLLFGVMAALIERSESGQGQVVDAAMVDGVPAMMGLVHGFWSSGQLSAARGSNWLDGTAPFYRCYACADGKFISVGALEPKFYAALLSGLGLPPHDDQYDTATWPARTALFAARFATLTRDAWEAVFADKDACVAPVLAFDEATRHPSNVDRGVFYNAQGTWQAQPAPRFSRSTAGQPQPPAAPGSDTADILRELGYAQDDIETLKAHGVLT